MSEEQEQQQEHAGGEGGKPDHVPDKFYDPDAGVLVESMAKAYTELEGKMRSKEDDLRESIIKDMKANAPDNYELIDLTKVEDFNIPEGVEMTLTNEDPYVKWFFDQAKDWGLSQDQVNTAIQSYVRMELDGMPSMEDEIKLLGDHGQDRLLRVHTAMEKGLEKDEFEALKPMLGTAQSIAAMEKLLGKPGPKDFDGEGGSDAMTLVEIRQIQDRSDYWERADLQEKVAKAYQRLYKNQ